MAEPDRTALGWLRGLMYGGGGGGGGVSYGQVL